MKRLILGRHSFTEHPTYNQDDLKRKLTKQGEKIAIKQMEKLTTLPIVIDKIISSHAERALQTSTIYKQKLGINNETIIVPFLYNYYTTAQFLQFIAEQNNTTNTILIVAHNPTISDIAYRLCSNFNISMQPATLAIIDFDIKKWKEIEVYKGNLFAMITP